VGSDGRVKRLVSTGRERVDSTLAAVEARQPRVRSVDDAQRVRTRSRPCRLPARRRSSVPALPVVLPEQEGGWAPITPSGWCTVSCRRKSCISAPRSC